LLTATV